MSKKKVVSNSVRNRGSNNVYELVTDTAINDKRVSPFGNTEE